MNEVRSNLRKASCDCYKLEYALEFNYLSHTHSLTPAPEYTLTTKTTSFPIRLAVSRYTPYTYWIQAHLDKQVAHSLDSFRWRSASCCGEVTFLAQRSSYRNRIRIWIHSVASRKSSIDRQRSIVKCSNEYACKKSTQFDKRWLLLQLIPA